MKKIQVKITMRKSSRACFQAAAGFLAHSNELHSHLVRAGSRGSLTSLRSLAGSRIEFVGNCRGARERHTVLLAPAHLIK